MKSVCKIRATVGKGLEDDRYFFNLGTYWNDPGSGRDGTLIDTEVIEASKRDYQIEIKAGKARRNMVTRGVYLKHLVGRTFKVGAVVLRGMRLCEPCAHMKTLTLARTMRGLIHRGGLRAEVVRGGIIRVGDPTEADDKV